MIVILINLKEILKQRISNMYIRYIGESDPIKQTLLEIYVAFMTNTNAKYNDFDTH